MTQPEKKATIAILARSLHGFLESLSKALCTWTADNPMLELSTFNTLLLQKNFKFNITSGASLTDSATHFASILTEQEAWSNLCYLFSKYHNKSANTLTLSHMEFVSDPIYHIMRTLNTPHGHLIISAEPGVLTPLCSSSWRGSLNQPSLSSKQSKDTPLQISGSSSGALLKPR